MQAYQKSTFLIIVIIALAIASIFSCLETAIVAATEYRLKSLKEKALWAQYAYKLKQQLNQVIIFSLFGNSLFNAIFTTLTTVIVTEYLNGIYSKFALPIATIFIALFIIIFSEAVPKIIAANSPLATLRLIAIPLYYLFIACRPFIFAINKIVYSITVLISKKNPEQISLAELKSLIADTNSPLKTTHRAILLKSLDLEKVTLKEVLIPLRIVEAINLSADIELIKKQLQTTHHTRIIVYDNNIDNILGFVHTKDILSLHENNFSIKELKLIIRPISFVHDFIPIIRQINHAKQSKERICVVINEYGDISGIACLEDMFEMVFGNFTTESPAQKYLAVKTENNELIVDGTMSIRQLNEMYNLAIKDDNETLTVNGLILKTLSGLPNTGVCFKIDNLIFEVINVGDYWVERVKITLI